jgi:predicted ABC-type exoprotein transport system permease subunit
MQKMFEEQGYQESLLVTSTDINKLAERTQKISVKDFLTRNQHYQRQKFKRDLHTRQLLKSQELLGCTFRPLTSSRGGNENSATTRRTLT